MFGGPVFAQLNTCDLREHALEDRASSRRTDDFTIRGTIGRLTALRFSGFVPHARSITQRHSKLRHEVRCNR